MKLIVVHHHLRPGGVRRVIELATPHVARALRPAVAEVVLATGEGPDAAWWATLRRQLAPFPVVCRTEPALAYVAEQRLTPAARTRQLRQFFLELFAGLPPRGAVVWVHNPGLGRNLALNRVLAQTCAERDLPLVFHHHDWWFDNRWPRWSEMRRSGFRTLADVARATLPSAPCIRHAAINQADTAVLRRHFSTQTGWLPNPVDAAPQPAASRVTRARRWLTAQLGNAAPVWLVPCRLLRRKNLAEALLLTRWLRPEAWLVTTGSPSTADEVPYARRLAAAAQRDDWPVRLGILAGDDPAQPSVAELLGASEAVLLTSLQEGFGLPYVEAAAAGRPLIARSLPNVAPDLARLGFRFPQSYPELLIDPALFDLAAERRRQHHDFQFWRRSLPRSCQALANHPPISSHQRPVGPVRPGDSQQPVPSGDVGPVPSGGAKQPVPSGDGFEPVPSADFPADSLEPVPFGGSFAGWDAPVPFSRLTLAGQLEVLRHSPEISWRACAPLNPFLAAWRERAARGQLDITPWPPDAAEQLGGAAYAARFARLLAAPPLARAPAALSLATQASFIHQKLLPGNLYPLTWRR